MAAAGEFVDGWLVAGVLGEGAYGEVRLLVHAGSGARVALKAVRGGAGAREAALHRALRHPHVLRCLGARAAAAGDAHYLFLEVADGGELFERIEPDRGMAGGAARRYWRQLAAGLRYLHGRGVAHRDIKPENLLLTARDELKLADFGLATLFRHGARERLLSGAVGTRPYCAPEVVAAAPERPYRAAPADTWAAALVMLAMLAGELPWERAADDDPRYGAWRAWCEGAGDSDAPLTVGPGSGPWATVGPGSGPWATVGPGSGPWATVGSGALRWLRRALRPAESRASLRLLLLDPWMCDGDSGGVRGGAGGGGWASQPAGVGAGGEGGAGSARRSRSPAPAPAPSAAAMVALLSLSQPAQAEELLESGQCGGAGAGAGAAHGGGRLRLRLTRLQVRRGVGEAGAVRALQAALEERRWAWRGAGGGSLVVDTGGGRRLRVTPRRVAAGLVLEFRRAAGCGLHFTRTFHELRRALAHIAEPEDSQPQPMEADEQ